MSSACSYRHPGKPPTCGRDKKACPLWRVIPCMAWDILKAMFKRRRVNA